MYIRVDLRPNSKTETVELLVAGKYKIEVKAKAQRNLANRRMLELLAQELGVPISYLRIINGHHTPRKLVSVRAT